MNRRITTALLAACLISGVCTFLLGRKVRLASAAGNRKLLRYVAPARALEAGAVLEPADLEWTRWPADNPLPGALEDIAALPGRAVLYPLAPGQPILDRELADAGTGGGLAARIPKGMRALALRSDDVVGVAGFLEPGSRVDVLVTYRTENSTEPLTATVLENAEVLAAGQRMEPDPTGKPASATVVTLLLSPLEAERAVLASTQGAVHFVLRNGLDKDQTERPPISLSRLGTAAETGAPVAPTGPPASEPAIAAARIHPLRSPEMGGNRAGGNRAGTGVETVLGGDDGPEQGKQP